MDKFEYLDVSLKVLIRAYIEYALAKKDWKIIAIDVANDKVVLQRFEASQFIKKGENV